MLITFGSQGLAAERPSSRLGDHSAKILRGAEALRIEPEGMAPRETLHYDADDHTSEPTDQNPPQ
jgi:hypothetical protein